MPKGKQVAWTTTPRLLTCPLWQTTASMILGDLRRTFFLRRTTLEILAVSRVLLRRKDLHADRRQVHYTDPKTGLFHVGYLYSSDNTSGAAGATTDNLVTYRDVNPGEPLFISPRGINDPVLYLFKPMVVSRAQANRN
jgi:hypothetical protein